MATTCLQHNSSSQVLSGSGNVVQNSRVYGQGGAAVDVRGGLHRSLTRGDNLVSGNEIFEYARWYRTYHPAINWVGVGNTYVRSFSFSDIFLFIVSSNYCESESDIR